MAPKRAKTKFIDENISSIEYAMNNKGWFINLTNLCGKDPVNGRFSAKITVTNCSLQGEKVKFNSENGEVEATVVFSCLGTDYKNIKKYRDQFKETMFILEKDYIEQQKVENYLKGEETDLVRLRHEGKLD